MIDWLIWVEATSFSTWMRESPSLLAFPTILFLHTLGLGMLAGISVSIDLWLLTTAARAPRVSMAGFYKAMWAGFGINAVSGVLLLIAYPAKALTNWVFFAKLLLIFLAVIVLEMIKKEVFADTRPGGALFISSRAKLLAGTSLALWAGAILTGRLLAYTYVLLMASDTR